MFSQGQRHKTSKVLGTLLSLINNPGRLLIFDKNSTLVTYLFNVLILLVDNFIQECFKVFGISDESPYKVNFE